MNTQVYKAKGKVDELEQFAQQKDIAGTIGIAHTRWATHGESRIIIMRTLIYSQSEEIAIIHNGIIENYHGAERRVDERGIHIPE
jgi:glucosamine--fructose-6-phosphate aminotransferase (isomerizing)